MSEELQNWMGLLSNRRNDEYVLRIEAVLESQSDSRGGSLPFKALASDNQVYWVKMLSNTQSPQVPITEQIVSQCGQLIGAPVCATAILQIPSELDGDMLDNGTRLVAGLAHGSKDLPNVSFGKWYEPEHRTKDDNRRRHSGYFALYDWCWGDDMQWLYDVSDDWKTYSHDHGHFFPGGVNWRSENLVECVDREHEIDPQASGLDDTELRRLADRLASIRQSELLDVLAAIPRGWPMSDRELETLGWFLYCRASGVALRLRQLADRNVSKD